MRIAQWQRCIGRAGEAWTDAECWIGQPPRSIRLAADGEIFQLIAEGDAIDLSAAAGNGVVKIDAFAALLEGEPGVNAGGGVGVVGVNDEILSSADGGADGKDKFLWGERIVGDAHAGEIKRRSAGVIQLD